MIWFKEYSLEDWNNMDVKTIHDVLGITLDEIGPDYLKGSMPIDYRTAQPYGYLHGGASVVLAESLGSMACGMTIDTDKFICLGQHVSANHLRPGISGRAHGTAKRINAGSRSQLWEIEIRNDSNKLLCKVSLQMAIIAKRS